MGSGKAFQELECQFWVWRGSRDKQRAGAKKAECVQEGAECFLLFIIWRRIRVYSRQIKQTVIDEFQKRLISGQDNTNLNSLFLPAYRTTTDYIRIQSVSSLSALCLETIQSINPFKREILIINPFPHCRTQGGSPANRRRSIDLLKDVFSWFDVVFWAQTGRIWRDYTERSWKGGRWKPVQRLTRLVWTCLDFHFESEGSDRDKCDYKNKASLSLNAWMAAYVGLAHSKSEVFGVLESLEEQATYFTQDKESIWAICHVKHTLTRRGLTTCEIKSHVTSLKDTRFHNQRRAEEHTGGKTEAQGCRTANCWCQERSFLPR